MKYDLTNKKQRRLYIQDCECRLIQSLRDIGFNLSDTAVSVINKDSVSIYTNYYNHIDCRDFGSDVKVDFESNEMFISVPYSGSFNPAKKDVSYWRYMHTAEIIKNMHQFSAIARMYTELVNTLYDIPLKS